MNTRTRGWFIGAIVFALIGCLAMLVPFAFQAIDSSNNDGPIGEVPDDIRSLIANPPEVDCLALAEQYDMETEDGKVVLTYIPNEVDTGNPDARNNSDSVNISAIPADRDRVNASISTQPEQAGMVGVALVTHYPILGELNPDLFGQFTETTPKEWADAVFSGEINYEDASKTMCQLAGITTIFDTSYERDLATEWNYYATPEVLTTEADVRPIVESPYQYTGDFLKYTITWKDMEECGIEFGVNVGIDGDINQGDQRIAGFACDTPPPPPADSCVGSGCGEPDCVTDCKEGGKNANMGIFRDWEEEHTVNNNDGATDAQGLQEDPVADAEAAEQAAEEEAAAQQEAHQDAVEDAPVVNQEIPAGPVILD